MIRIAIVGPESTGKSTLAEQLAKKYKTVFVPEAARDYISKLNRKYTLDDINEISRIQLQMEDDLAGSANKILFCDTNLLVTKIWANYVFHAGTEFIEENLRVRKYDLHLLTHTDIPWTPDPQREHPLHREELFQIYRNQLDAMNVPYAMISGIGATRFQNALAAVEKIISSC